jgi:hypothetical protein
MKMPQSELFALPIVLELDDLHAVGERRMPVTGYAELLTESVEQLYRDETHTGRLLVLHLHPWLSGQPCRIRYLDRALGTMLRRHRVWAASGTGNIDWYQQPPPTTSS